MLSLLEFLSGFLTIKRKNKIEEVLSERTRHFTIVAEDTYQDHNASALVRTCDCFGIQQMNTIQKHNQYTISKGMTQGAEKWVDINYYYEQEDGIQNCITNLRNADYQIVATLPQGGNYTPSDFDVSRKSAFFFGREKEGLSPEIIQQADQTLSIPMVGFTESLNISVAAAILLKILTLRLKERRDIKWRLSEEELLHKRIDWYLKTIPNYHRFLQAYLKDHPEVDQQYLRTIIRY